MELYSTTVNGNIVRTHMNYSFDDERVPSEISEIISDISEEMVAPNPIVC